MNAITRKWRKRGVHLEVLVHDQFINLVFIEVPKDKRCKGIGTKVMLDVNKLADKEGKMVILYPTDTYGSDLTRLRNFYRRFGYTLLLKRRSRYLRRYDMIRYPTQTKEKQ